MLKNKDNSQNSSIVLITALGGILFVAGMYLMHLHKHGWFYMASDDSYIYLGYVKSFLLRGELFSYNPGEYSGGTTGILYYYVLSAVGAALRTFYWPANMAAGLTLTAYLLNGSLFVAFFVLLGIIWRRISSSGGVALYVELFFLFSLILVKIDFLWGWFGGLENPLTSFFCLLLVERCLAGAPWWQISVFSAGLAGCRPEITPVAFLIPVWVAVSQRGEMNVLAKPTGKKAAKAAGLFLGLMLITVAPCWYLTGSLFPASMGTRIAIPILKNPLLLLKNIIHLVSHPYTGFHGLWMAGSPVILLLALACYRHPKGKIIIGAAVFLYLFIVMRILLHLTNFSAHDRYISYLWPLYALIITFVCHHFFIRVLGDNYGLEDERIARIVGRTVLTASLLIGGYALIRSTLALDKDITEMNQAVVEPSRWMAENLPPGSRIAMESAGAIRVFTDFYLIDDVGLTTKHKGHYYSESRKSSFWEWSKPDYVFESPNRLSKLKSVSALKTWTTQPRIYSYGTMGLYRISSLK
ncbi:MAG: hypothetical protein ACE5GM_02495 [bacterium]